MENNSNLIIGLIALVVIAIFIISNYIRGLKRKYGERIKQQENDYFTNLLKKDNAITEKQALINKMEGDAQGIGREMATKWFEEWKQKEMNAQVDALAKNAFDAAQNLLVKWKQEEGEKMRTDAIKRSMAVNLGKITEHLIPFSKEFFERDFSPQDTRFIGSPVDLIIFDGAAPSSEKDEVVIYFVEVKTGKSPLKENQRKVRNAVLAKRVEWLELKRGEFSWES